MTTAVVAMPATAPLAPPATVLEQSSNRPFASIAPSAGAMATPQRTGSSKSTNSHSPPTMHEPSLRRTTSDGRRSPQSGSNSRAGHIPKVIVKKEPTSPDLPTGRHRPSRLNLASSNMTNGSAPAGALSARPSAGPLTSRDSAGLHLHDIGVACLSPGFNTQDPTMREQMERAMNIREQQRRLIENRQKGKTGGPSAAADHEHAFGRHTKTPITSRRKGPPPGLSIAAPPAEAFANERVIQSAPLHASFPRHSVHSSARGAMNGPSGLSHIHHAPANQTTNRLPPIADVFPEVQSQQPPPQPGTARGPRFASPVDRSSNNHSNNQPPLPSPGYPPHTAQFPPTNTLVSRPREHKSAEEALKELTGGREDLLPRLVHYGGHQPPTPPSPRNVGLGVSTSGHHPHSGPSHPELHRSGSSRRRDRDEYERDNGTPPLGRGPMARRGFGGGFGEAMASGFGERESPATERQKKEEFLSLVSRAWDLWHS